MLKKYKVLVHDYMVQHDKWATYKYDRSVSDMGLMANVFDCHCSERFFILLSKAIPSCRHFSWKHKVSENVLQPATYVKRDLLWLLLVKSYVNNHKRSIVIKQWQTDVRHDLRKRDLYKRKTCCPFFVEASAHIYIYICIMLLFVWLYLYMG